MPGFHHFLRCVGKASLRQGVRALLGFVPLAQELYDIASEAISDYQHDCNDAQLHAEIAAAALAGVVESKAEAVAVVREIAADQTPEVQLALESFLTQVPPAVRQSLRRPEDPTGTTIAAGRRFGKPEELVQLLPQRLARFKPGDRPLVGVSWELVELLGVGGFGEVWKARHLKMSSRKPVALKFCLGLDAHAVEAMRNELEVVDRVMAQGVPGIVPLLEAYLETEPYCLAFQLIEGGDLAGYLQARSGLSWEQATRVALDLARTMSGPHGMNPPIAHRDLKPANILVEQTADGTIKLWVADFGIGGAASAHTLKQELKQRASHRQSLPTALRGSYTPIYAPRQQREGNRPDPRDDVYALGIIWYQLLTGDLTAERPGGRGWRKKLESRGVTVELLDLLESCIDDEADERPKDARDLAVKIDQQLTPAEVIPWAIPVAPSSRSSPRVGGKDRRPGEIMTLSLPKGSSMRFAWVPPGSFRMGGNEDVEKPIHTVQLTRGFFMGIHQVTQAQWQAVMGSNPSGFKGEDLPVENVSWDDCQDFCRHLEKLTQKAIRLPTEAEWEYACRAGTTTEYSTGNGEAALGNACWHKGNSQDKTHPVGKLAANAWGLYDMHGNVWEWCADWFGPYPKGEIKDENGPEKGESRIFRGGSWDAHSLYCRSASRLRSAPSGRIDTLGCRVVFCLD